MPFSKIKLSQLASDVTEFISSNSGSSNTPTSEFIPVWDTYTQNTTLDNSIRIRHIIVDTTSGSFSLTLPSTPINGDIVEIVDKSGKLSLNPVVIIINGTGRKLLNQLNALNFDVNYATLKLLYISLTNEWVEI